MSEETKKKGLFSKGAISKEKENFKKQNADAIQGYDDLLIGKKNSSNIIKFCIGICAFVVIVAFWFAVQIHISTVDKVKVIDQKGNILKSTLENRNSYLQAYIETHCANTVYYLNSFDRLTIKENQARALFLVNSADANRVFNGFNTQNNYADALTRGVSYDTNYDKLLNIDVSQEPYRVRFQSVMTIYDSELAPKRYLVISEGELMNYTAQYPENPVGLYFKRYNQSFKELQANEQVQKSSEEQEVSNE